MDKIITNAKCFLIIGGLTDPCATIGTEGKFEVLAYPCPKNLFRKRFLYAIECDKTNKSLVQTWRNGPPEDVSLDEYLERGVGVRIWQSKAPCFEQYLSEGYSEELGVLLEPIVDDLSLNHQSIDFIFGENDALYEKLMSDLEKVLVRQL